MRYIGFRAAATKRPNKSAVTRCYRTADFVLGLAKLSTHEFLNSSTLDSKFPRKLRFMKALNAGALTNRIQLCDFLIAKIIVQNPAKK